MRVQPRPILGAPARAAQRIQHGGSGGKAAAPIAKKVIKKVLERHELREKINYPTVGNI